jgi:diguanylate cyclase (GGDEF)-like protein
VECHRPRLKERRPEADTQRVKFDLTRPTEHQFREGLISGLIAVSIIVPLLVTVNFVGHRPVRWVYIDAAVACVLIAMVYAAFFMVMTSKKFDIATHAGLVFAIVCVALAALGLIELGSSTTFGTYNPAVMVGVIFISIIGDRWMRIGIDTYSVALIAVVSWAGGLRGSDLLAVVLVYASTIVIITWITARTVGSLNQNANFRHAIATLNEAIDGGDPGDATANADDIQDVLRRGLPLVSDVIPADRAAVFARNAQLGRFTNLGTWPDHRDAATDLAELPELHRALRADAVVVTAAHCIIPIGYCAEGELVLVVSRRYAGGSAQHRTDEGAALVAAAFLRVTSRANFVSGLQAESRTDPLTGLANRRTLYERIEVEMEHALRSDTPLTVAMIDLDYFKKYNDQFGHVAGDTLLRSIAALMVSNIRGQDLVVRYGGEEFCLVLPETDIVGGHHLLDKLREGGRDATTDFGITLSAGLTSWDGIEDTTSLIDRADQALYRAKESGRNRVVSIQSFTEF